MNRFTYISLIFCLGLNFSCEKEIDPTIYPFEKKLVLNCLFGPDAAWQLQLFSSENIFDSTDQVSPVDNATIRLFDSAGSEVGSFINTGEGIYEIPGVFPVPNERYEINVIHTDYPSLMARSGIPGMIPLEIVARTMETGLDFERLKIDCQVTVPAESEQFLVFSHNVQKKYFGTGGDTLSLDLSAWIQPDPAVSYWDQFLPLSVEQHRLYMETPPPEGSVYFYSFDGFQKQDDPFLISGEAAIRMDAASPEYYAFMKSLDIYLSQSDLHISSIVSPVDIFSNIEGGLGIFAGYYRTTKSYNY